MKKAIGIIDSGVGGLSIWQKITKLLPHEDLIYLADQKNFPYGTKNAEFLRKITSKNVEFLIKKQVKLIVLACNTATVHTLSYLREKYRLPIVGTVPVIKKAAELSKNGKIGVIATSSTNKSQYQKKLIKKFASGFLVSNLAQDGLVELVENLELSVEKIIPLLAKNLRILKNRKIDVLALGCTHYAFLKPHFKNFFGKKVLILDSAGAVARQVRRVLKNNEALAKKTKASYYFYTTGDLGKFKKQLKFLLKINPPVKRMIQ